MVLYIRNLYLDNLYKYDIKLHMYMLYYVDPIVRFTTMRADCGSLYVAWTVFNSKICDVIYSTVIYSSSDFTYTV